MAKRFVRERIVVAVATIVTLIGGATTAAAAPSAAPSTSSGDVGVQIVNGDDATATWTVSLQSVAPDPARPGEVTMTHECGGTLIAPRWVMTAAHCAPYVQGVARIGSYNWNAGGELGFVKRVIPYPAYPAPNGSFGNDIALVELFKPARATPFPLGAIGQVDSTALTAGWGMTCDDDIFDPECRASTPDRLKQIDERIVPGDECTLHDANGTNLFDSATMYCAVAADGRFGGPCFGDSGSPLLRNIDGVWHVVGIQTADMDSTTPHADLCSSAPDGGTNHAAGTNIQPFKSWILRTIQAGCTT